MATSFLTNGVQQQQVPESDPDYNLTLTAETFSGMRQAIAQSMEIDPEQMTDFYNQQAPQQNGEFSRHPISHLTQLFRPSTKRSLQHKCTTTKAPLLH